MPLLIFVYTAAVILGTYCFGQTGVSRHGHHQSSAPDHPLGCLLACDTSVAEKVPPALPPFFILFLGFSFLFLVSFPSQRVVWKTHDRAPPLLEAFIS